MVITKLVVRQIEIQRTWVGLIAEMFAGFVADPDECWFNGKAFEKKRQILAIFFY